jgi:bacterioferritin-associated ferredoxin
MKETTAVETGYLCHCLRITGDRFEEILENEPSPSYPLLKEKHGIGSMCSSCEYEAKGVLTEYLLLHPEKSRTRRKEPSGLCADIRLALRQLRAKVAPAAGPKPAAKAKVYHTGIFFLRRDGLESHLVVSNLQFPEHERNINGDRAIFRAALFGGDGQKLATSAPLIVATHQTLELTPRDLFPALDGDFTGGLYVDYDELVQTGSLRPYGVLVSTRPDVRARCHYHDKFGLFRDPGFFQNTSPFEPGQTCCMALSNCQPQPYETKAIVQIGGRRFSRQIQVGPMASLWVKFSDLFPDLDVPPDERSPALFWLENPQHVMVYFFWFNEAASSWMGQHH